MNTHFLLVVKKTISHDLGKYVLYRQKFAYLGPGGALFSLETRAEELLLLRTGDRDRLGNHSQE